jgi:hypothetical protein
MVSKGLMGAMIPRPPPRNGGLASFAAQLRGLAARFARAMHSLSLENEGAGKAGCADRTRSLAWELKKPHECRHHRFAGNAQLSPRNGFTAYFVLSPVTGLFCHRRLRKCFRKLDASVGASGPHDFAVRFSAARQRVAKPSIASHPASVTIAIRPSIGVGQRGR